VISFLSKVEASLSNHIGFDDHEGGSLNKEDIGNNGPSFRSQLIVAELNTEDGNYDY